MTGRGERKSNAIAQHPRIDATSSRTRDDFVVLLRQVLRSGLFQDA